MLRKFKKLNNKFQIKSSLTCVPSSESDIKDIFIFLNFWNCSLHICNVSCKSNANYACFSFFEHNVLQLLHIPFVFSKDFKCVGKNSDLIKMADAHFVKSWCIWLFINSISAIYSTTLSELQDNSDSFFSNSTFCLFGTGSNMMSPINSRMLSKGHRVVTAFGWLSIVSISSIPEIFRFF